MKYLHIVIALVLSAGLVHVARTNLHQQPEQLKQTVGGFTLELETIPKGIEVSEIFIPLKLSGPMEPGFRLVIRQPKTSVWASSELRQFGTKACLQKDSTTGEYEARILATIRGGQLPYYFEVRDGTGGLRASFMPEEGVPFVTRFIGEIPGWVMVGHAVLVCVMILCIAMGSVRAFSLISGGEDQIKSTALWFAWAAVATFIGGYLFGAAIQSYMTGIVWAGVPFGTGIIENKTQLVFIVLLLTSLLFGLSLRRGNTGIGLFSNKVLGMIGVAVFPVTALVILIPNTIELSETIVKSVIYAFTVGAAGLYFGRKIQLSHVLSLATKPNKTGSRKRRSQKK